MPRETKSLGVGEDDAGDSQAPLNLDWLLYLLRLDDAGALFQFAVSTTLSSKFPDQLPTPCPFSIN